MTAHKSIHIIVQRIQWLFACNWAYWRTESLSISLVFLQDDNWILHEATINYSFTKIFWETSERWMLSNNSRKKLWTLGHDTSNHSVQSLATNRTYLFSTTNLELEFICKQKFIIRKSVLLLLLLLLKEHFNRNTTQ
jgi:hypothetical protein